MKRTAVVAVSLLVSAVAYAGDGGGWETVGTGKVTIKMRALPGEHVREILAEGDLDAPARAVAEAVVNADNFAKFMPYTKESRFVGELQADGSRLAYLRISAPVIADRDFFLSAKVLQPLSDDGTGEFKNAWHAVSTYPHRHGIVRVTTNTGGWTVRSLGPGRCHAVYRFVVDPGGALPEWIADLGNRSGVPGVFAAVEKEAKRLETGKLKTATAQLP